MGISSRAGLTRLVTNKSGGNVGVWRSLGIIFDYSDQEQYRNTGETNLMYETGAQLIGTQEPVFKCWYVRNGVYYAESLDGVTWVKTQSDIIDGVFYGCASIIKVGSTYHLYVSTPITTLIKHFTSPNGVSWTLQNSNTIPKGSTGTKWNGSAFGNTSHWVDPEGTMWMMVEAYGSGTQWAIGLYTSTDYNTFTEYNPASNPVIAKPLRARGGPSLRKVGNRFYVWCHGALNDNTGQPVSIHRYSADAITGPWTEDNGGNPVYWPSVPALGQGPSQCVADPDLVEERKGLYVNGG